MLTVAARRDAPETEAPTVEGFLGGAFRLVQLTRVDTACQATVHWVRPARRLSGQERRVVERLVCGSSQKAVACDLGVATSTVSAHLRVALAKLGLACWEQAVLAAAVLDCGRSPPGGVSEASGGNGAPGAFVAVSAPLCAEALGALSPSEREVVLLLVDCRSNWEICALRRASVRTVANQIAAASRKLAVHGRFELIRRLVSRPGAWRPGMESASMGRSPAALWPPEADRPSGTHHLFSRVGVA
jgi:DNA-binding NarL/FixJ family response regulator